MIASGLRELIGDALIAAGELVRGDEHAGADRTALSMDRAVDELDLAVDEFHQPGSLGISNHQEIIEHLNDAASQGAQVDVGLQVGGDGRIWLCVDGMAFIRFKPNMAQIMVQRY